ncbi:long-chain fatty acid--CoA ligase [Streptomyces sp. AC627_RSS907]|uniref:AMP-dependent synthetase/ligase n=1 Tax=Streptomyces sp. AC627_RSS907 TaxID=2823684 RepID=UPI001C211AE5|nr:long-chain fatty acid--CoA ligase [Streptomyces sp. AC627_RSS907]
MSTVPNRVAERPASVLHLLSDRVRSDPDAVAYRFPARLDEEGPTQWDSLTWSEAGQRVQDIAAGLTTLGVAEDDRVGILATTRMEWILVDLAVMSAGAATTTVYPTTNADETAYILADSGSTVLIAEDAGQLEKVLGVKDRLPRLRTVVLMESAARPAAEGVTVLSLEELRRRGAAVLARDPRLVEDGVRALAPGRLATLIYTSGTTGRPKGVRLTHDCWSYQAVAQEAVGTLRADDVQYLWLPLSHVFGKSLVCGHIATGHVMYVDGRVDRVVGNLSDIRPTVMAAVPRIFEKAYNGIATRARESGRLRHAVFRWAAQVAREHAREGRPALTRRLQHRLADRLVYAKIREVFGGRMRAAISGSAALVPEIGGFFLGAGVPVLEGYGLTETSAGTNVNPVTAPRIGTVGPVMPGTEVRIAADGEVLLRGPAVMEGYHGLPDRTAEVLEPDGWFHTGDIGELDADGYLRITDRKKDVFKTSNGKYVAPSEIEGAFKALCPFAGSVMVVGSDRNYCTALIGLDAAALMPWAAEQGMGAKTYAEVIADPATIRLVDGYVRRLNERLQRWQTVKKFTLLPRDLDIEHGELTPTLKVKRRVVAECYAGEIDAMYEAPGAG